MKVKMTRKEIQRSARKVFYCGYCELYPLYNSGDAVGYNAGIYGWNYHVHFFGSVAVTTGYRGMFGDPLPESAKRILKNAEKYCSMSANHTFDQKNKYLNRARRQFRAAIDAL